MRAVVMRAYGDPATSLSVDEVDAPVPARGQVLVKVAAAAVNPSDMLFVAGTYGFRKPLPAVPGFEGAGVVVGANAGLYGRWLMGRRVAVSIGEKGYGTWAEYVAADAFACVPLLRRTSMEFGASMLVNPLTALTLLGMVRAGRHRAFIQTAAASALGTMVARLADKQGMTAIDVVRRPETAAELRAHGRAHVLCSAEPGFEDDLAARAKELGANIAFDAVGGELTRRLGRAMPRGSRIVVFGALGGSEVGLDIGDAIFRHQSIEGFWMVSHARRLGTARLLAMTTKVQRLGEEMLGARVLAKLPLERLGEAVALQARASEGKVLLAP